MPENPPIELLYFVLKSYKSPIFLLIFSYFSYNFFWKMGGMYEFVLGDHNLDLNAHLTNSYHESIQKYLVFSNSL